MVKLSSLRAGAINLFINLKLTIMDEKFEKIYEIAESEEKQYVYEVFESDAWHSYDSVRHMATYLSLEEAVDAIIAHGEFDEEEDLDYIREHLLDYRQTPETGDVNYEISVVEIGTWNE